MKIIKIIKTACHEARLHPMTGDGLLIRPRPEDDIRDPLGGPSLHALDYEVIRRQLDALGWDFTEDEEDGGHCHDGYEPDGRERIGLCGREPIITLPTMRESAEAFRALRHSSSNTE